MLKRKFSAFTEIQPLLFGLQSLLLAEPATVGFNVSDVTDTFGTNITGTCCDYHGLYHHYHPQRHHSNAIKSVYRRTVLNTFFFT
jgi:hypothetical protein